MNATRIAVVVTLCLFAHTARAGAQQLTILSAHEDNGTLVVNGGLFANGIRMFVALTELTVTSVTPTEVRATLPTLNSGSYLLILFQSSTSRLGTFLYAHAARSVAPVVFDKNGQVVGTLLDTARVIREVNGVSVALNMDVAGFSQVAPINVDIVFKTSDCTGTPYFIVQEPARVGRIALDTIYFANEPFEQFKQQSTITANSATCFPVNVDLPSWFGPLATAPLPSFTPPFVVP